jgi:hypothetical protein
MNYHRLSQGAEWAVLAAVIGLHALVQVQSQEQPAAAWVQIAGDAQALVAIILFVAWVMLGPGPLWVRTMVATLPGFGLIFLVWHVFIFNFLPLQGTVALIAPVVFAAVRSFGPRVSHFPLGHPDPRPQFSIRGLLVTTTLVAATIGGLEMLGPRFLAVSSPPYSDLQEWLLEPGSRHGVWQFAARRIPSASTVRQIVLTLAIVGSALGGLATVLRPGLVWLRLAILAITLPTLAAYLTHLAESSSEAFVQNTANLAVSFAAVAALTAISVLPLRLMGYRLCIAATSGRGAGGSAGASPSRLLDLASVRSNTHEAIR